VNLNLNSAYLGIVGALTALMLIIFLATGQPWKLTVTAIPVTALLALGAVYFYSREEEIEEDSGADYPEEDDEAANDEDQAVLSEDAVESPS
jgi:hypothetical protein